MYFLGYSSHYKGYKCLDKSGKIIIFGHVIFNEHEFPFQTSMTPQDSTFPNSSFTTPTIPIMYSTQPSIASNRLVMPSISNFPYHISENIPEPGIKPSQHDMSPSISQNQVLSPENQPINSFSSSSTQAMTDHNDENLPLPTTAPTMNQHNMITRSKSGIFKPKILVTNLSVQEPSNFEEACNDRRWLQTMTEEYEALIKNNTWTIVELPKHRNTIVQMGL